MEGFCSFASGSKGNCAFLGTKNCKLLIDIGLSKSILVRRLHEISVHPEDIQAILITHEHSDHISGLKSFTKTFGTPVICNLDTAKHICNALDYCPTFKIFSTGDCFTLQDIKIKTFTICHDAIDPVGFLFYYNNYKIGFCTDIGFATSLVCTELYDCDFVILEANHDPILVHKSEKPLIYKNRVLSKIGHLSNESCGLLLQKIITPKTKQIYLAHLSNETNTPELAYETVSQAILPMSSVLLKTMLPNGITDPLYFASQQILV